MGMMAGFNNELSEMFRIIDSHSQISQIRESTHHIATAVNQSIEHTKGNGGR